VHRRVRAEHLDRDIAVVLEIAGEIHARHAAGTEQAEQFVAVCERCLQRIRLVHEPHVEEPDPIGRNFNRGRSSIRRGAPPQEDRRAGVVAVGRITVATGAGVNADVPARMSFSHSSHRAPRNCSRKYLSLAPSSG